MTPGVAFFYGGMVPWERCFHQITEFCCDGVCDFALGGLWVFFSFFRRWRWFDRESRLFYVEWCRDETEWYLRNNHSACSFMLFQCTFAIITPALITGAVAERVLFQGVGWSLWLCGRLLVYVPVAHWVWGLVDGSLEWVAWILLAVWLFIWHPVMRLWWRLWYWGTEEISALMSIIVFPRWWFFAWRDIIVVRLDWFNAGSALAADGLAAHAAATTILSGCGCDVGMDDLWLDSPRGDRLLSVLLSGCCGVGCDYPAVVL